MLNSADRIGHRIITEALSRAKRWYGQSVTEPAAGTSSSVPKVDLNEWGWESALGERAIFVALEYGTYTPERGRLVLREGHYSKRYRQADHENSVHIPCPDIWRL